MTRTTARLALFLAALLLAEPASADARADLKAAYEKSLAATSFRASMTDLDTGRTINQIEFVAPDRFAITMEGGMRQVVIGRTMHMNIGGRTISMPLPEQIDPSQYRNQKALDDLTKDIVVTRRPDASDAGELASVFHFASTVEGKPTETLTWVSKASGLPIQIQTTGGDESKKYRYQIRYRDYNDPSIVITAPGVPAATAAQAKAR
jgi:outer membrane lipoprotein-sorting protein